jgi:hypothetical protein
LRLVEESDAAAQAALAEAYSIRCRVIDKEVRNFCLPEDRRARRTGKSIITQQFPRLAQLLTSYLKATAEDSELSERDYNWLVAQVLDFMIKHRLAVDLEEEAYALAMQINEDQSRAQLLTLIQEVLSEAPRLREGYNAFIAGWRDTIRERRPDLEPRHHDFMVLEETMMLVWLALKPKWLAPPEDSQDDITLEAHEGFDRRPAHELEHCPGRGGLRLVWG